MYKKSQRNGPFEDEFLLSIVKDNAEGTTLLVEEFAPEEFKKLLTLANLHGMIPQLHKSLKTLSNVKEKDRQTIQKHYTSILQANLLLTANLLTVTKALETHQFKYLSIKGPTLAQELYQDISMRQFSDIDLFVDEKDIYAISECIIALGYTPVLPLSLLKRKKFLELDNDFSFRHDQNNVLIELHWKLFPLRHKMPLNFTTLYNSSKKLPIQNREITTLSEEDNLLYLTLHGSKHIFERYEWVYDLHQLIRNYPDLDLNKIYLKAKNKNIDVPFLLGIFMSHALFGTHIPRSLQPHRTEHIQNLIDKTLMYYEKGFVHWNESEKKRARFLFLSDLFQNKESKILWLIKSLFKTTPVDVITFNLPDAWAFLYPVMRPFRLLYKHLFIKRSVA